MTMRTFLRDFLAAPSRPLSEHWRDYAAGFSDPLGGRRAGASRLVEARRYAQAVALRDAAEWVELFGDEPVRPIVVAKFLRARAERIEAGNDQLSVDSSRDVR